MEEIHDDGSPTEKTFEHVPTEIGAEEAEEVELILKNSYNLTYSAPSIRHLNNINFPTQVGVEHLLRDVKDTTVGTLSQRITGQLMGLKGLNQKLQDMKAYLEKVAELKDLH